MEDELSVKLTVSGKVQGVSFRWFTVQAAREMGLCGYAKNLPDGTVEVMAEGTKAGLESLIKKVKQGSPFSKSIQRNWLRDCIRVDQIIPSSDCFSREIVLMCKSIDGDVK
mgnify:CR=1 FL=1